jgi:hypothetical protein
LLYPISNAVQRRSHSINKRLGRINITRNIKHVNHVYHRSMSMLKFANAIVLEISNKMVWYTGSGRESHLKNVTRTGLNELLTWKTMKESSKFI